MSPCPYCAEGNIPVQILGLWVHQFSSRWISCNTQSSLPNESKLVLPIANLKPTEEAAVARE